MTTVRKKQISLEMEKSGAETDKAAAAEEVTTTSVPDSTSDIKQDKSVNGDSGVESADDKKENSSDKKDGEEKAAPDAKKKKSPKNKETKAAEPAQNEDEKECTEGEKIVKKEVKKTIPAWASINKNAQDKLPKNMKIESKASLVDQIVNAIKETANSKGVSSVNTIRKYLLDNHNPDMKKFIFKKAMQKALDKNIVKQTSGKGISGSFRVDTAGMKKASSAKAGGKGSKAPPPSKNMEEIMPDVFTWVTYPKEASINLIRKYLGEHHSDLSTDGEAFKKAIEGGIDKKQLDRISGKGMSGTLALVDGANKSGAKYEDPIENAIIAMNEPKECSVTKLRDYLSVYHPEYNTDNRPQRLKTCLDNMEAKGWIIRISGKGFSGTFRLNYPFYPSPKQMWGDEEGSKKSSDGESKSKKRKITYKDDSSEDESSVEESEDEDGEVMPTPKKRGAGPARKPQTVWNPKFRASDPPPPKKLPAKKAAAKKGAASKKKGGKAAAKKKAAPATKKAAPAAKKPAPAKKAAGGKKVAAVVVAKKSGPVARKSRA